MSKRLISMVLMLLVLAACSLEKKADESSSPTLENTPLPQDLPQNPVPVSFYLLLPSENSATGTRIGCGDGIVLVSSNSLGNSDLAGNLQIALNSLFAAKGTDYAQGYINHFETFGLQARHVDIVSDTAVIELQGDLLLSGVCADAAMQSQILLTIFQYPEINNAQIFISNSANQRSNLKQLFDASGMVTQDALYTRADIGYVN